MADAEALHCRPPSSQSGESVDLSTASSLCDMAYDEIHLAHTPPPPSSLTFLSQTAGSERIKCVVH